MQYSNGPKAMPLMQAYQFGNEHGLEAEIDQIREMEIEWDLSYTSSLRRGYIVDLFQRLGLMSVFIKQHWPEGEISRGEGLIRRYLAIKSRYEEFLAGGAAELSEENDLSEQAFAAESDLRDFLSQNLNCIESGLRLYRDGEREGVEFNIEDGRIDILAIDSKGKFVVIELKLSRGRNKALGQLLYYMGWVDANLGNGPCRGIAIAREISDDLKLAARRAAGVSLYRYKLKVSLEKEY